MAWRILSADGKSGENYNLPAHMNEVGMTPGSELAGKVALVTGGARNIGRAISRSLAAGGATVMVNANTSHGEAKHTVAMIKSNGGAAACYFADVTDPAAVAKMVDATVRDFGRLDILLNTAEPPELPDRRVHHLRDRGGVGHVGEVAGGRAPVR